MLGQLVQSLQQLERCNEVNDYTDELLIKKRINPCAILESSEASEPLKLLVKNINREIKQNLIDAQEQTVLVILTFAMSRAGFGMRFNNAEPLTRRALHIFTAKGEYPYFIQSRALDD